MMADGATAMWMQRYARRGDAIEWGELTETSEAKSFLLRPWGRGRKRKTKEEG